MLGLRWKYLNTTISIKNCLISFCGTNSSGLNFTNEIVIEPQICKGWPGYYCYFNNTLDLKNVTEIKVILYKINI